MLLQLDDFDDSGHVIETPTEPIDLSDVIVTCAGTIRFQGYINGHPVQLLVDGGSTDNFLNHVLLSS
jgi:hypothetical protein